MKNNILLLINTDSFSISRSKAVFGEIYFKIDNECFPEIKWNDFIVIIMRWWIQSFIEIIDADIYETFELAFMDGPFLVRGVKIDNDTISLDFLKNKIKGEEIKLSTKCSILEFKTLLKDAAKAVLETVERRNWDTKETVELKEIVYMLS